MARSSSAAASSSWKALVIVSELVVQRSAAAAPAKDEESVGATHLALYDVGVQTAMLQMPLSQRPWTRLTAISGKQRLMVQDGPSDIGGDLMTGSGCIHA